MNKYTYDGPVKKFDQIVANNWHGETMADSEAQARSHLTYRYKVTHGLAKNAKITLPGKIKMEE